MSRVGNGRLSWQESSHMALLRGSDAVPATGEDSCDSVLMTATNSGSTPSEDADDELEGYWLGIVNLSTAEWRARIDTRKQVIGRKQDADIRVPSQFRSVSRQHAEIWVDRQGANLCDLGSTLGTRINDAYIAAGTPVQLRAGDRITLGGCLMILGDAAVPALRGGKDGLGNHDQTSRETMDKHSTSIRAQLEQLTPAENQILLWISRGVMGDDEIGKLTHRSPNTVRTHVANLLRKLNLHSRAEVWAFLRADASSRLVWQRG